ncbi:ANTAR domain-containing protein [Streptomyces sp. NBC_01283]|uniref:ANTAR domain-containing protein n=1 Tax=Streptomyces sp. NBC_01283 TaxID=2903812 RepID=UPI00352BDC0B|nr:ANTAR domain-containing protein [Streptomyces sp. NBC_01283]
MASSPDSLNTSALTPRCDPEQQAPNDDCAEEVAEIKALRTEVNDLHRAMESHPPIDQARGMLMTLGPCTAEEAWEILVEVSQHSNTKLRAVADELIATTDGEPLPSPIRTALAKALSKRQAATG